MRVPHRGRAILRRIGPRDAISTFRPGDFVLTTSDGAAAGLLGIATSCELNHAALIVDPLGTTVEANPNLLADARAYRTASVADYLRAGRPCWIGYVELREGTRQEVVALAEHLVRAAGAPSPTGRLLMALHTLVSILPRALAARVAVLAPLRAYFDEHALVLREELCYSSGELVARALERGGFIWDRDPAHVTPAYLFDRFHLREPAPVTPLPLRRLRPEEKIPRPARGRAERGKLMSFAPRAVRGANALAEAPRLAAGPEPGVRALLKVGLWTAAGLTCIALAEDLVRSLVNDG